MDTETLQFILEKEHKDCIEWMHKDFNLPKAPEPASIIIEPERDHATGGINMPPPEIYVGNNRKCRECGVFVDWRVSSDTLIHETIHYLHFLSNEDTKKYIDIYYNYNLKRNFSKFFEESLDDRFREYVEFIALLGLIKYRGTRYPNREMYFKEFMKREYNHEARNYLFLPAYFTLRTQPDLLNKIQAMKHKEALPIINDLIEKFSP